MGWAEIPNGPLRGRSAVGSASEWHSEGRGFESLRLHDVPGERALPVHGSLAFFQCLRPHYFSAQDVEARFGGTRGAQDASRITG